MFVIHFLKMGNLLKAFSELKIMFLNETVRVLTHPDWC